MAQPFKKTTRIKLPEHVAKKIAAASAIAVSVEGQEQEADVESGGLHYYVFAEDRQIYGPATLGVLQEWAAQGLVSSETWVFDEDANTWKKGRQIKEMRHVIPIPVITAETGCSDLSTNQLRRIRLFSDMDDSQVQEIMPYLAKVQFPALKPVVRKGEHGSYMYLLLSGEAVVTTTVDGISKVLNTLRPGDFFGELTLFEEGPRPCDISANTDCTFLRLKHQDFQTITAKHPELAARFLTAIVRQLSYMILDTSNRFAQAKAMVRGSLRQTGQIMVPPIIEKRKTFN